MKLYELSQRAYGPMSTFIPSTTKGPSQATVANPWLGELYSTPSSPTVTEAFSMSVSELLKSCHVVVRESVVWGEMDAFGHLNNVFFFRHFENCRIGFFDKYGFTTNGTLAQVGPILAETSC